MTKRYRYATGPGSVGEYDRAVSIMLTQTPPACAQLAPQIRDATEMIDNMQSAHAVFAT